MGIVLAIIMGIFVTVLGICVYSVVYNLLFFRAVKDDAWEAQLKMRIKNIKDRYK